MIVLKRLLITTICFLVFIPAVLLANPVSYSKSSNLDTLSSWYFKCSKHPTGHFVAYYLPPTSAHINSSNYEDYGAWKYYYFFIIQPNGKVKNTHNSTLSFIKMDNGRTYGGNGSLVCYAKDNNIYNPNGKLALYVKNNVLYDRNNNFIVSSRELGPLTSFYNIQGAWLGLRADLSQENILTYLAFYYSSVDSYGNKIPFTTIREINSKINSNYVIDSYNKYVAFYYKNNNGKLESPEITLGYKDGHSFYNTVAKKQLIGRYHLQTGLITNYKGAIIGKITKNGYVYGKTNNLLGRIGKFRYNGKKNGSIIKVAKIYNATGKHIAYIFKLYEKTD